MTMTDTSRLAQWVGGTLVDDSGDKIGKIDTFYVDEQTEEPEWIAVATGLFGTRVSFVPLEGASPSGDSLRVPYSKDQVKDAPHAEPDGHLSPEEEEALYRHYGLAYDREQADTGHDTSGPNTDRAMTRSEEELRVGTTTHEKGKARLRKWVETEQVTQTVPVSKEQVRVEREPITEANVDRAMDGPEISEEEHEVTIFEDEVVASKQAVPKERVRLDKEVVTDEQTVSEDLRKERIEVEGDVQS